MKHLPDATPLLDHAHKYLIYCYVLSSALGLVSCILFSLVWSHWHSTLDTCYNAPDCGCILYVSATTNVVAGADIRLCAFVSYTQLGVALGAFALACYYCARSVRDETRRSRAAGRRYVPANRGVRTEDSDVDPCLTPIALTSGLVSVLLLCTAYMSTEGYYRTCSEYRKTAARTLKASGNLVSLIYERLSCDSVLDLMDYTAPNTPRRDPRGAPINTPFLLGGAIIAGWAHLLVWLVLLGYNTLLARRRRGKKGVKEWNVSGTNKSVSGTKSVKELNSGSSQSVSWTNKNVNGTNSVKEWNVGTNKNVSGANSVKELNSVTEWNVGTNKSVNGTKSEKELNSESSQSASWTNKNVSGTKSVKELNSVTEWNVGTNENVSGTNSVKEKSVTRTKSMMGMIHFNGAGKPKVIGTETAI